MGRDTRMNLQLFAEGEAAAAAGAASANTAGENQNGGERLFTQADVENMINQRFAKLQREADKRVEAARKEALSEGERLASMSAEERVKAQREKEESDYNDRVAKLDAREAEIVKRELRTQAEEELAQKGLPKSLSGILNYAGADECKASIEAVEQAFREAVKTEVDKRIAASAAPLQRGAASGDEKSLSERLGAQSARASAESRKHRQEIINRYK